MKKILIAIGASLFFWFHENENVDWKVYRGGSDASAYSELDQITKENVQELEIAWTYHTGDNDAPSVDMQCNPIIIDGILYATSPKLKVFALEAATGKELWKFDPFASEKPSLHPNRGVVYWEKGNDKRILYTAGEYLYALNARNGVPIKEFGKDGRVNLHKGLDKEVDNLYVVSSTPGIIHKDLLIVGTRLGLYQSAPGHIRAYNVVTGERAWVFHTIPQKGERGAETWPEEALENAGGANSWAGFSLDEKRGLVFIPTGSPAYDFYGGNRKGQNLYGNSLIAVKAETGEYVWHFQTVHHDLWDRDLPCQPNLLTVEHSGRRIDAVAQATKSGYVFLFDRETGKPLFPIEEKPYPGSDLLGEATWPTQPLPIKPLPFARQALTEAELTNISAASRAMALKRFREVRSAGQFVPPSKEGTVIFPGFDGGAEWGGAAVDPEKGIMYINSNEMPWILTMIETAAPEGKAYSAGQQAYTLNCTSCHGANRMGDEQNYPSLIGIEKRMSRKQIGEIIENGRGRMPAHGHISAEAREAIVSYLINDKQINIDLPTDKQPRFPYVSTGYHRFKDQDGYPAVKPPWGTLNAIDLNTGEYRWKIPLGEFEELTKKGIPPTGTENYGGPILTKSGLLFIGATQDNKFRAIDSATGKILWETKLPAGGYATPSTYSVNGKQYIVIAAGGNKMKTRAGDSYVAFALKGK
ncbi:MAG: PQQ-binding-like beta-propeller repeat protein [Bacteroidetes bacterium]|nr:PQQ-binding-like beta-propeller repeat protein [Bacteroidota bacterium]